MKVKKGLPLYFLPPSWVLQPPSCSALAVLKVISELLRHTSLAGSCLLVGMKQKLVFCHMQAAELACRGVLCQSWHRVSKGSGRKNAGRGELWDGRSVLWGCTVPHKAWPWHVEGMGCSFSGYCVMNKTWHFSESEVILFLSLLFWLTLLAFLWFPPSPHPQTTTQIISSHSVRRIIRLQRTLILMLENQNSA